MSIKITTTNERGQDLVVMLLENFDEVTAYYMTIEDAEELFVSLGHALQDLSVEGEQS